MLPYKIPEFLYWSLRFAREIVRRENLKSSTPDPQTHGLTLQVPFICEAHIDTYWQH